MDIKINKTLFYLILSLCVACQDNANKVVALSGNLELQDTAYTGMWPVLLHDGILFSRSGSPAYGFVANNLNNNQLGKPQELFRIGNGHNEFHNLAIAEGKNSSIALIDWAGFGNKLLSLTMIEDAKDISSMSNTETWKIFPLDKIPNYRCVMESFVQVSDSEILIPGSTYEDIAHIMSIIDFKKQLLTPLDYWPNDGVKGNELAKHSVYTDNCRILGNNENRYLYKCGEERFAFIFSIENKKINIIKELYSVYPKYKCEDINYSIKRSGKSMYADANNKCIYNLLLDNKVVGNSLISTGNVIEVFDWDGNLLKTINLDKNGYGIKVNKANSHLYLFSINWDTGEQNRSESVV